MAKKKRPRDVNELARQIVDEATGQVSPEPTEAANSAAVELGRKGGLRGGAARAAKLSSEQRSEIARKAARSRWGHSSSSSSGEGGRRDGGLDAGNGTGK